jgi:hypothetical protein
MELAEDEKTARKERAKRHGTYATGMNMAADGADGYTLDELLHRPQLQIQRQQPAVLGVLGGLL